MLLTVPRFDFRKLVFSHGWVQLAPLRWDEPKRILGRPLRLPSGENVDVQIAAAPAPGGQTQLQIEPARRVTAAERALVRHQVRRMLWLDYDFSPFHDACRAHPRLSFVSRSKCGALLRSPTLFEDLVKTVCTTNCDWRNTKKMCDALCRLGDGNFPTPQRLLSWSADELARETPLGYRVRTVQQLADLAVAGKLPLYELAAAGRFEEAADILRRVWGIGPYARRHAMMLLGDFSEIPVDCEVLKYLRHAHFGGRPVSEREAVEPYAEFGRHRFLAFKFGRMARKLDLARAAAEAARPARGSRAAAPCQDWSKPSPSTRSKRSSASSR